MSPRHLRSTAIAGRSPRRTLTWLQNSGVETLAAGTGANRDLGAASSTDALGTIMRLLLYVTVENWAAAADIITIGTVKGRAADIGTSPLLASMPGLDWSFMAPIYPESAGAAISVVQTYRFDLKSRRKVQEVDERYLVCFDNGSAASKTLQWFSRLLVAEP
jgi:hypothetical protein